MTQVSINEVSIEQYDKMEESQKQAFYDQIVERSPLIKNPSSVRYKTFYRRRIYKTTKTRGYHQPSPKRLMVIAELTRRDKLVNKVWYLCVCDCGNWHITRNDNFDNEESNRGCFSCGCLNKEVYLKQLNSKRNIKKRTQTRLENLDKNNKIPHANDIINKWQITETKIQNGRRYIKGICPYCKDESHWIRYDSILEKRIVSCGCRASYFSVPVENICRILEKNNIHYITEKTFNDCIFQKSGKKARFDLYVNNQYIIEYDGEQHFIPGFGHDEDYLKALQSRDSYKNFYCFKNNIPLIRIPYTAKNITLKDLIPETSDYLLKGETGNEV